MDGDEECSYSCVNNCNNGGWDSSHKSSPQRGSSNSDLGDMSFMMLDYIKEAMKVRLTNCKTKNSHLTFF